MTEPNDPEDGVVLFYSARSANCAARFRSIETNHIRALPILQFPLPTLNNNARICTRLPCIDPSLDAADAVTKRCPRRIQNRDLQNCACL